MNVLIIGDEHTYGYGLTGKNLSYIGHFIRLLNRTGQSVSVEAYAHLTMSQTTTMLAQLPLSRYDLIILQLDSQVLETELATYEAGNGLCIPVLPYPEVMDSQSRSISRMMLDYAKALGRLMKYYVTSDKKRVFAQLLKQLRLYRHNVLLITPLPHLQGAQRWLRSHLKTLVLREAASQSFSVFNSGNVIGTGNEYFLPNDTEHLNAVSHELLGRSLFDFYQSTPTIITVQSRNRNTFDY